MAKLSDFLDGVVRRLTATGDAIGNLTHGVSREESVWKPEASRWSILEVVNHLADEEVEDFRTRVDIMNHRPEEPFPSVDPQGWVLRRDYAARPLDESLDRFRAERDRSLSWLKGLESVNLDREKSHLTAARFTARQLLVAWTAHDLLHLRQITKLRYDFLAKESAPISLDYAGRW
jgi:hypothetical protein